MSKDIIILGSTGSIGSSTLSIIRNTDFKIKLLTTNTNVKKILNQAINFNVKDVIVEDKDQFKKFQILFKKKRIRLHCGLNNVKKIVKKKVDYCVNSITGIDGLLPTLDLIPLTKNILIANKESLICGWHLIQKSLKKNRTTFIPLDSEHYSIYNLIKHDNHSDIEQVILTASGGPFLNKPVKIINNAKPHLALKHPNWKMGKKISIDSSTMMNKIFEYIEAKKIFKLKKKQLSILIHPSSFVHAIIFYKGGLIKFLAHEAKMTIPISNALRIKSNKNNFFIKNNLLNFNKLNFKNPDKLKFPLLSLIRLIPEKDSYFETILITLNDLLVYKYLKGQINYISIQKNILNLIKKRYFTKYYKLKPNNIYDIKKIINLSQNYLEKNLKHYEN